MAILPIRQFGDPVLRTRAAEVERVDRTVRSLMQSMTDTMRAAPGVGLAANQVGVVRRVIVWENEEDRGAMANPAIVDRGGEVEGEEGCLSLPGLAYPVVRSQWVVVEGLDERGKRVTIEAENLTARIFQHEIDHLNGVLYIDHLPEELRHEANARLKEMALAGLEGF
jgi:peptide deformylase